MKITMRLIGAFLWSLQLARAAGPSSTKPSIPTLRPSEPTKVVIPISPSKPFPLTPTKRPSTPPTKRPSTPPTKRPSTPPTKRPSVSPTKRPSVSPVKPTTKPTSPSGGGFIDLNPPSSRPTSLFSISTDNATYAFNTTVTVTFTSPQPRADDFITIFPVSTPTNNLAKGLFWLWTCNQQGTVCSSAKGKGTVTFGPKGPFSGWGMNWPLPAGQYRVYLVRNSAPPYTAIAQSKTFTVIQTFDEALAGAKSAITALVNANAGFVPQFLRLIFHDCVGGCDGCIDMTNHDNSGLSSTIDVLNAVSDAFANNFTGLSRSDIWSMSAIIGANLANKGTLRRPVNFTYDWFGRVDCENANKVCFNASKQVVPCGPKAGPHRDIPGPNLNSTGLFSFFDQEFGFSEEQAVAAMGAHAVGRLFRENSGIDGPDGWQINNQQLRSEYYEALLGSANAKSNASEILTKSPRWDHIFLNNIKFDRPDRFFWRLNVSGKTLSMLNADIAMARKLDNSNMNPVTGKVNCSFNPSLPERPLCPLAGTVSILQKFLINSVWLNEFKSVLDLISTNGYIRKTCTKIPCRLVRKP